MNPNAVAMMLALINRDNNLTLAEDQVSFGIPVANTNESIDKNSKVVVAGVPDAGLEGSLDLFYNRVNVTDVFPSGQRILTVSPEVFEDVVTTRDAAALFINARNLRIDLEDVLLTELQPPVNGVQMFLFRALPGALTLIGEVTLSLHRQTVEIGSVVQVTDLNGLTFDDVIPPP